MRPYLLFLLAVLPVAARCQGGTGSQLSAAIQLNTGAGFDDDAFGFSTTNRRMSYGGLTLYRTRANGDDALLLYVLAGNFADAARTSTGERTRLVAEWTSTFDVARSASGRSRVFLAGQLFRDGQGFRADLAGVGGGHTFGAHVAFIATTYARHIEQGRTDIKQRLDLTVPMTVGGKHATFGGYEDLTGARGRRVEASGLWQLLLRGEDFFGTRARDMQFGVKWFNHARPGHFTSAPHLNIRFAL
jgi:hypothetical protein